MSWLTGRACHTHQAALIDFASGRSGGAGVRRALDHVDRCPDCEAALAATTLLMHGLRRLHEEILRVEPAADGWARLRARLSARRRDPSRVLSGLPGAVAAVAICAALVGPAAIAGGPAARVYNEAPRGAPPPYLQFEKSRERASQAGLLPEPEAARPYRGVRIAPPPVTADLPPWMGGQAHWIEEELAPAASGRPGGPAAAGVKGRADRR